MDDDDFHFRDITNKRELGVGIFLVIVYIYLLILNIKNFKNIFLFSNINSYRYKNLLCINS